MAPVAIHMTEENRQGLDIRKRKDRAEGKIRLPVLYRIDGRENFDGKIFSSSKCHRAGVITNRTFLLLLNRELFAGRGLTWMAS